MARSAGRELPPSVTRKALLVGGSDLAFRAVVDDLVRLGGRLQAARAGLATAIGVTPPQYNIVMHLARHAPPEGLRLGLIAAALDVSLSFVVAQTRGLRNKRLVVLRNDPADRRAILAALSPAAERALVRAAPLMQSLNDRLFAGLARSDLLELGRLCATLHDNSAAALETLAVPGQAQIVK